MAVRLEALPTTEVQGSLITSPSSDSHANDTPLGRLANIVGPAPRDEGNRPGLGRRFGAARFGHGSRCMARSLHDTDRWLHSLR
jgi:hypothetical protein